MSASSEQAYLCAAIRAFRVGMEGHGNDCLEKFLETFAGSIPGDLSSEKLYRLEGLLAEILAAQERGDYLWVADLLEYELAPGWLTGDCR